MNKLRSPAKMWQALYMGLLVASNEATKSCNLFHVIPNPLYMIEGTFVVCWLSTRRPVESGDVECSYKCSHKEVTKISHLWDQSMSWPWLHYSLVVVSSFRWVHCELASAHIFTGHTTNRVWVIKIWNLKQNSTYLYYLSFYWLKAIKLNWMNLSRLIWNWKIFIIY